MKISAPQGARLKILIVEDDDDIQALLKTLLTRSGYEVEWACSGITALAALSRFVPDLILLDMAMPYMDGIGFLERKNNHADFKNIPVIVLSARDRDTDVAAAIDRGVKNYLTKPFDNTKLLDSIALLLPKPVFRRDSSSRVVW